MNLSEKVSELDRNGYCVLEKVFEVNLIDEVRRSFWETLTHYLKEHEHLPNRGIHRHFVAMPFNRPVFSPEFFFDRKILRIARSALGDKVVIDQWGCDIPVFGSNYQNPHVDYQRPLFIERPDLLLPPYMLVVSFGLVDIGQDNGNIEIAPGTHRLAREDAIQLVTSKTIPLVPVPLKKGDVLIRHPWAIHRGTPNLTQVPRPLITLRYVRPWYRDDSRDVNTIPLSIWKKLSDEQQFMMRFPVERVP